MFRKDSGTKISIIAIIIITAVITSSATYLFINYEKELLPHLKFGADVSTVQISNFNKVRGLLKSMYYQDVSDDTLVEGAIAGMAKSVGDPYTVYFTKEQMQDFKEKAIGSFTGIGVYISVDPKDNLITVISPIKGAPAEKVGILPGDKIIKVDNKDITAEEDEDKVVSMIKGLEGTNVKITVYRPSENQFIDFDIIREKIRIENIESEILEDDIGYIKISQFIEGIALDFITHFDKVSRAGAKGIIIDVRDNAGGVYHEVVAICDLLLPRGIIVYTEDKNGNKEYETSDERSINQPIAVLINEYSASASEILAGAIKDHDRGVIVGNTTFGKGLVQNLIELEDGAGLKLTVSRYFTPSGVCIQGTGIEPNVEINLRDEDEGKAIHQIDRENDTQLMKAIEILRTKM